MPDTLHFLTLLLYVMVTISALNNLRLVIPRPQSHLKPWVLTFCVTLTIQAVAFLAMQIDWVVSGYDTAIDDWSAWGWLLFDYFNGFALFAMSRVIYIWVNYSMPTQGRRALDL